MQNTSSLDGSRPRGLIRDCWRLDSPSWILNHENSLSQTSLVTCEVLFRCSIARNNIATVPQSPFSPDLAPSDFLFPRINRDLKRLHFDSHQLVQNASTRSLNSVLVAESREAYQNWKQLWQRCVIAQGVYFEECWVTVQKYENIFFLFWD